ncbi:glycosyltransferase [Lysinibacillus irui]|uniref:glycosyltransferase family protein n=1 Tax=Lysinibacillus irui TaxID=2998077 RepID=UPI0038838C2F
MKKVLLLKGYSNYNVLRYWIDSLARGFEKLGIETIVLDTIHSINEQIIATLQMDVDAVISFNGILTDQQEILNKIVKAPYIFLLIDHPINHLGRIQNLREEDIITLMDRYDVHNLELFGLKPKNVYMLPHAAIELSMEPYEKTIDILVSGSYSDMSNYKEYINRQSPAIRAICEEVIENCLSDSTRYYIEEFLEAFKKRDITIELRLYETPEFIKMVYDIGRYVYSINRLKVITALAEAGYSLDIYGDNWASSPLVIYPNVHIHESVNYWQTQELMRKSKIVMNFQALLRDGTHERIFAGMAANSVVVTNETPYLRELFSENEEIIFYNFDNLGGMIESIQAILLDDGRRERISKAAWQAVKGLHTFEERAQMIVDIFNDVKLSNHEML